MTKFLPRGLVTTWVVAHFKELGFPVGDCTKPEESHGWAGEPNRSKFTPWLSTTPLTATMQRPAGAMANPGTDWIAPYSLFVSGIDREQTEHLADAAAKTAEGKIGTNITLRDGTSWRVQDFKRSTIGTVQRIGAALPDHYTQNDQYELWLSKEM